MDFQNETLLRAGRQHASVANATTTESTFSRACGRMILIGNLVFSVDAVDPPLQRSEPLGILFTQLTPLLDACRLYRYVTWDSITIRIVLTSTPFMYGALMIKALDYETSTYVDHGRLFGCADLQVLEIQDQATLELTIPWFYPLPRITCASLLDGDDDIHRCPTVYITPLVSVLTLNDTDPQTLKVAVYAKLNNPHFSCAGDLEGVRVASQSSSTFLDDVKFYGKFVQTAADPKTYNAITDLYEQSSNLYNRFFGNATSTPEQSETVDSKAVTLSTVGSLAPLSRKGEGNLLYETPAFSTFNGRLLGDSDIHNLHALCMVPQYESSFIFSSLTTYHWLFPMPIPALGKFYKAVTPGNTVMGDSRGYMAYLAQFFRLWRGSICIHYLAAGSPLISARIRFSLSFNTAPALAGDTTLSLDYGKEWNEVVTVKGMTSGTIVVPWTSPYEWLKTGYDERYMGTDTWTELPMFSAHLIEIVSSGTNDPRIPIGFWVSAGPDFEMRGLQDPYDVLNTPVEAQSSGDFRSLLLKDTKILEEAFVGPQPKWEVPTIEAMMSRWMFINQTRVVNQAYGYPVNTVLDLLDAVTTFDRLHWLFYFHRGSDHYRLISETNQPSFAMARTRVPLMWQNGPTSPTELEPYGGIAWTDTRLWNHLEVVSPYLSANPVEWNYAPANTAYNSGCYMPMNLVRDPDLRPHLPTDYQSCYWKAGPDYQVIGLRPPPPITALNYRVHTIV